jgi:hypothetical protein
LTFQQTRLEALQSIETASERGNRSPQLKTFRNVLHGRHGELSGENSGDCSAQGTSQDNAESYKEEHGHVTQQPIHIRAPKNGLHKKLLLGGAAYASSDGRIL